MLPFHHLIFSYVDGTVFSVYVYLTGIWSFPVLAVENKRTLKQLCTVLLPPLFGFESISLYTGVTFALLSPPSAS